MTQQSQWFEICISNLFMYICHGNLGLNTLLYNKVYSLGQQLVNKFVWIENVNILSHRYFVGVGDAVCTFY